MVTAIGRVISELDAGVLRLTLSNPSQRNALTPAMLVELRRHVEEAESDSSTRVIVIRGEHGTFSSGYSLTSFPAGDDLEEDDDLTRATSALAASSKATICVLNGDAIGAAFDLALCADFRIAVADARIGITPARFGIVYSWQGIERAVRVLGEHIARRLLLTGELMPAVDASAWNGVDEVAASADALDEVEQRWIAKLLRAAPLSIAGMKRVLEFVRTNGPSTQQRIDILELRRRALNSADAREATDAFREKRSPIFLGR